MSSNLTKSIFELHKKKTIVMLIFIILVVLLLIVDNFLYYIKKNTINNLADYGTKRYIYLREHNPNTKGFMVPNKLNTDSLEIKEYLLRIDKQGFIKPSKIHNNADLDIIFLGGSTTECHYIEEEKRFPYLVGRLIENNTSLKINSYNSGVSGNNSLHSIDILINKLIPLKPDIIVFKHNINDLTRLILDRSYWTIRDSRGPIKIHYMQDKQSSFYFIYKILENTFPNIFKYFNFNKMLLNKYNFEILNKNNIIHGGSCAVSAENIVKEFAKNIKLFIAICKIHNIKPVLMTQANRFTDKLDDAIAKTPLEFCNTYGITYIEYKNIYDAINQKIREISISKNTLLVDLAEHIPQTKKYMYDQVHYNNNGSILASKIIATKLLIRIQGK